MVIIFFRVPYYLLWDGRATFNVIVVLRRCSSSLGSSVVLRVFTLYSVRSSTAGQDSNAFLDFG